MIRILKETEISRAAIFDRQDPVADVAGPVEEIIKNVREQGDAALK